MSGFIVLAVVASNVATLILSAMIGTSMPGRTSTYQEAASEFGLNADAEYPLSIGGAALGGTTGTITTYGGFFSVTSVTDLHPTTSVNLSFSYEDKSWVTTIPTDIITFHIDNDKPPSVAVDFKNGVYGTQTAWDNERTTTYGLSNGMLGYAWWYNHPDISLSDTGVRDGLAPIVNQGVAHVDITLSDTLYKQVFNLN